MQTSILLLSIHLIGRWSVLDNEKTLHDCLDCEAEDEKYLSGLLEEDD